MSKRTAIFSLIAIIVVVGIVINLKEKPIQNVLPVYPLQYTISDDNIEVLESVDNFDFTAEQLLSMSEECGGDKSLEYFQGVISDMSGAIKHVYQFEHTGDVQSPSNYTVTVVPNLAGYESLDQFKLDFDICAAGATEYPTDLNENWLMFTSSCGSGFDDGSGRANGCLEIQDNLADTLKLN